MKRSWYLSASAMILVLNAASASAQDAQLEDIVVTAQKRTENLQNVPIAMSAVTAENLSAAGINRMEDLSVSVPGFSVTRQGNATQLYIRGVGSTGGAAGQESAIATFVDGVYMPAQTGATFSFNNIERLEVLKGPQGTLYGRNATGGALNIITRTPRFTFGLEAEIGAGNLGAMEGNLYVTGPVSSAVAIDLAATYRDQNEGFGTNIANGRDISTTRNYGIRSKMLIQAGERTEITLSGDYGKTEGTAIGYRNYSPTSRQFFTGLTGWPYGFWDISSDITPRYEVKVKGVSGRIEHDADWARLTSITAYRTSYALQALDIDESELPLFGAFLVEKDKQFTQELQLASSGAGRLTWIVGGFFLDGTAAFDPWQIQGQLFELDPTFPFRNQTVISKQTTKSYALFGQASYALTPRTKLTLGARYTIEKRSLNADGTFELLNGARLPAYPHRSDSKTFKRPTWRIALDHELVDDVMVYGSYNRGFLSGVYNLSGNDVLNPPLNPETLDAFEVGVKSTLLDRKLRLNVSGFYYKYKNLQLSRIVNGNLVLVNAARAKMYGVDVDITAVPAKFLTISGGGEYLHHRYENFPNAPFTTTNNSFPFGNIVTAANASGNQLNRTPDFTFTLSADLHFPLAGGEFSIAATYLYNDGFFWEPDNDLRQDAYGVLNGQVKWTAPSGKWYVRSFARNLLNEKYFSQGLTSGLGDVGVAAAGRTYGAAVGVVF